MAEAITFYESQAESCGKAAAAAGLANERDKFLQAQAAWQALADKTAMVQAQAAKREAERALTKTLEQVDDDSATAEPI